MYFLPSEIARLVLGYLEEEKCDSTYETFLTTSPNLTECLQMREMGRKFRTKVMGLSLTQILNEYLAITSTVDERLEKVDPEAANSLRNSGSLLDKVTFLLNANSSGQTMLFSITLPHGKSPSKSAVAHVRKRFKSSNIEKVRERKKSRQNENDNSICEELTESKNKLSDVDTTPLCSLPGNTFLDTRFQQSLNKPEDSINRTPKRKGNISSRKPKQVTDVIEENLDFTVLTKALLDNREFHEKLAENINKVRTPEVVENIASSLEKIKPPIQPVEMANDKPLDPCSSNLIYQSSFYSELDNAFKKIVQDTEADPVFKNILLDVITEENSDDCEDRRISHTSTPHKHALDQKPDKLHKETEKINETRIDSKNNSATENNKVTPSKLIEDQNFDAIQSIIAVNSKLQEQEQTTNNTNAKEKASQDLNATMDSMLCDSHLNVSSNDIATAASTENTNSVTTATTTTASTTNASSTNPVISSATSLETTITNNMNTSTSVVNSSIPQSFVVNQPSSNIVVITQASSTMITQPTFILANSTYQPVDKQLLVISQPKAASQYVLTQQPQTTVLTERDIMTMPTIFMYEKDAQKYSNIAQPVYSQTVPKPKILEIQPKLPESHQKSQSKPQVSITLYADEDKDSSNGEGPCTKMSVGNVQINISPVKQGKSVPMISLDSAIKEIATPDISTPKPQSQQNKQSMSTPRSARSHIRALDFSTPPKEHDTGRKANTSPKSAKLSALRISSSKKKLKKGLFSANSISKKSSPIKLPVPVATRVPTVKLSGGWDSVHGTSLILGSTALSKTKTNKRSWDEDLRALCSQQTAEEINKNTNNKKTNNKKNNTKKKKEDLNNTEEEANKIEELITEEQEISDETPDEDIKHQSKDNNEKPSKLSRSKSNSRKTPTKKDAKKNPKTPKIKPKSKNEKESDENDAPKEDDNPVRNMNPRLRKKCNVGDTLLNKTEEPNPKTQSVKSKTVLSPSKLIKGRQNSINKKDNTRNSKGKKQTESDKNIQTEDVIENAQQQEQAQTEGITQKEQQEIVEKQVLTDLNLKPVEILTTLVETNQVEILVSERHDCLLDKITPTTSKVPEDIPITFKTNLTPILETPVKFDTSLYPITPRIFTPFGNTDTPFSKILNENLGSVDFSAIPTPNFPITPNFSNLTPSSQIGDGYNRPTDYSTSSSYYQPSDCEQGQVLDNKLIEESKKFDSIITKNLELKNSSLNLSVSSEKEQTVLENADTSVKVDSNKSLMDCSCLDSSKSSNSSSSSSSGCSCSSDSSFNSSDAEENLTVIQKNITSPTPKKYMLRSRKTPLKKVEDNDASKKTTPLKISLAKQKVTKLKKNTPEKDIVQNKTENINQRIVENIKGKLAAKLTQIEDAIEETTIQPNEIREEKKKELVEAQQNRTTDLGEVIKDHELNQTKNTTKNSQTPNKEQNLRKKTPKKCNSPKISRPEMMKRAFKTPKKIASPKKPPSAKKPAYLSQPSTCGVRVARCQTKIDKNVLESLAEKRQRVVNNMKNEPTKKIPPKKTNAKPTKSENATKPIIEPTIETKRPIKEPKKSISIDLIATKLRDQKTGQLTVNLEEIPALNKIAEETQCVNQSVDVGLKNLERDIAQFNEKMKEDIGKKSDVESHDESEDFPRLHLSSDEEDILQHNQIRETDNSRDDDKKLQDLKDRGIHLVPKTSKSKDGSASSDEKTKIIIHDVVVLKQSDQSPTNEKENPLKSNETVTKTSEKDNDLKPNVADVSHATNSAEAPNLTSDNLEKSLTETMNISFVYNEHETTFVTKLITEFDYTFVYNLDGAYDRKLDLQEIAEINKGVKKAAVFSEEMDLEQIRPIRATPYLEAFSYYQDNVNEKENNDSNKQISVSKSNKNDNEKMKGKALSLSDYKNRTNETVDKVTCEKKEQNIDDNDLFDFAATGNKIETQNEGQGLNWKKRKLIGETSTPKENSEKRIKQDDTKFLLKNVDVDKFLSRVHGPSKSK